MNIDYTFHWYPAFKILPKMLYGSITTIEIAFLSIILGIILGVILALAKNSNNKIIFNILSWFVCLIPLILIFSNALSDIIVVCASLFFIYVSIKENNWEWIKEKWFRDSLLIYFWLIITSFFAYDTELALSRSTT